MEKGTGGGGSETGRRGPEPRGRLSFILWPQDPIPGAWGGFLTPPHL